MIKPIPIRISRAGRLGRAEFEVSGHMVTVLTTRRSGTASAGLAVRTTLGGSDLADAPGRARVADEAAAAAAEAGRCGVMVTMEGDIAVAGEAPVGGWLVRLTDSRSGPHQIHLAGGGVATARSWSLDAPWRTVTVVSGSCAQARAAADLAARRGRDAAVWLGSLGLAARLTRPDGTVALVGHWPLEAAAA